MHKDNIEGETPETTKEHGLKLLDTVKKTEDKKYVLQIHQLLKSILPASCTGRGFNRMHPFCIFEAAIAMYCSKFMHTFLFKSAFDQQLMPNTVDDLSLLHSSNFPTDDNFQIIIKK